MKNCSGDGAEDDTSYYAHSYFFGIVLPAENKMTVLILRGWEGGCCQILPKHPYKHLICTSFIPVLYEGEGIFDTTHRKITRNYKKVKSITIFQESRKSLLISYLSYDVECGLKLKLKAIIIHMNIFCT